MDNVKVGDYIICDNVDVNALGHLTFAGQDTTELVRKYGSPVYLLDEDKIREKCRIYIKSMKKHFGISAMPLYAGKALCFKKMYDIIGSEGMGADVVSSGEIYTAATAGFDMSKAFFHGNNKTDRDIEFAIKNGVGYFVCDNIYELEAINEEAGKAGKAGIKQKILIRVTPGIDPHTHAAITTGKVDSKFGAAVETGQAETLCKAALKMPNISLTGFHCHIGSQIFTCKPFCDAATIMLRFIADMKEKFGFEASDLNLGGGMGVKYIKDHPSIDYEKNIAEIASHIKDECEKLSINYPRILMEPGRSIVADAGMTLYTVGGTKEIPGFKKYVSIDGGMPDNPRFALYQSDYTVVLANKAAEKCDFVCTVAGRCCESGDLIQENVSIPKPKRGDILAVLTTGAYNYSMASNYNRIARPPVVILSGGKNYVGVAGETLGDLIKNDM